MFKILSLDGGGIRGIYTASILFAIEKNFGINIFKAFDMFAGTSTGGILACALATGNFSAQDLIDIYKKNGSKIFDKSFRLSSMFGLLGSRYTHEGLQEVLTSYFSDYTLSSLQKKVMIPTINLKSNLPEFNKNFGTGNLDLKIVDALISTSSAPTYFPPNILEEIRYIDGGLACNNPSLSAVVEAIKLGYKPEEIRILSLGTGIVEHNYSDEKPEKWGKLKWLEPVLDILMDMSSKVVDYQLDKTFGYPMYLRINSNLERAELDLTDEDYLNYLIAEGQKSFFNNRKLERFLNFRKI